MGGGHGRVKRSTRRSRCSATRAPTEDVGGVDLQDEPAVRLVGVGAEDGEDGALLARLRQQLVHVHVPLREAEVRPRLALVGAEPGGRTEAFIHRREVPSLRPVPLGPT